MANLVYFYPKSKKGGLYTDQAEEKDPAESNEETQRLIDEYCHGRFSLYIGIISVVRLYERDLKKLLLSEEDLKKFSDMIFGIMLECTKNRTGFEEKIEKLFEEQVYPACHDAKNDLPKR